LDLAKRQVLSALIKSIDLECFLVPHCVRKSLQLSQAEFFDRLRILR